MQKNKVVQNYLFNVSYQILLTVLPLITIPYLTRVLGAEHLGTARYVESVVSVFTVFGLLGLVWYANRAVAYNRQSVESLSKCFWEIFYMRLILMAATTAVYLAVINRSEYKTYYLIYLFHIAGTFIDTVWFFTGIEEMKPVVIRNYILRVIFIALLFFLVRTRENLAAYIWLVSLTTLVSAVIMLPFLHKYVKFIPLRRLNVWGHFLPALALFLPQAASQIYVQCDKIMLKVLLNQNAYISFYTENEKIAKIPIVLASALSTVLMPRIAHEYVSGHNHAVSSSIRKAFHFTCMILFPCCFGLMAIANDFVPVFLGPEFRETWPILLLFCPVMILIGISNVTGIQYLVALDKTRELTASYVAAAVTNVIINSLLIPVMGVYGAIIGTLAAEGAVVCIQYRYVKKDMGDVAEWARLCKILLLSVVMGAAAFGAGQLVQSHVLAMVVKIIVGIAVYAAGLVLMKEFPFVMK